MARISGKVDTSSRTVNSGISVTGPGYNFAGRWQRRNGNVFDSVEIIIPNIFGA